MAVDVLFEFDAPQTFQDLSAPLSPLAPGEHDVWFDQIHPQHSKPSADLAREAAGVVRKLQEKEQQLKDVPIKTKFQKWGGDKENECPQLGNKQLKLRAGQRHTSLKEMRATYEPFDAQREGKKADGALDEPRKPLVDAHNRLNLSGRKKKTVPSDEKKEKREWQELLKRHNKKFKTMHTYEPRQHSVREVKEWERKMKKTYYALSAEERVQANKEIAVWKQQQGDGHI